MLSRQPSVFQTRPSYRKASHKSGYLPGSSCRYPAWLVYVRAVGLGAHTGRAQCDEWQCAQRNQREGTGQLRRIRRDIPCWPRRNVFFGQRATCDLGEKRAALGGGGRHGRCSESHSTREKTSAIPSCPSST